MRVRLTTDRAGYGFVQYADEIVDLPKPEALRLIKAGQAEPVGRENAMTAGGPETAVTTDQHRGRN